MKHARNVGPNLFAHNENITYIMPRGTACAVTSCVHRAARACRQAGHPGVPGITYGCAVRAS